MSDRVLIPLPGIGTLDLPREVYEASLRLAGGSPHEPAAATTDSEPLLNASEMAREPKLPKSCIYEKARTREIPSVRVGKHVRFRRSAVFAALGATASEASSRA